MIIHNQDENSSQRKFIFKMKPYSQEKKHNQNENLYPDEMFLSR